MLSHGHHFSPRWWPRKNGDAKAELNRRSQACDILTGTGISRREKWEELLAPATRVSAGRSAFELQDKRDVQNRDSTQKYTAF